jgi:hypothetical protein
MEKSSYFDSVFEIIELGNQTDLLVVRNEILGLTKIVLNHQKNPDRLIKGFFEIIKIIDKKYATNRIL